jgi:hypothetical protein
VIRIPAALGDPVYDAQDRVGFDNTQPITYRLVLVFIERDVAMGTATFTLPEIHIHSANAVGRRRMTQAIQSIKRLSGE